VRALALSPDGQTLAVATDWKIKLYDIPKKRERLTLEGHKGIVSSLAFQPGGPLLMSGSWDKSVKLWDATSGRHVVTYTWPTGRVQAVAFAPDGLRAAAAGEQGALYLWDVDE
jgi:WD40 repeat protein